eukprot:Skav230139  [mRNA]  locus=scaffold1301:150595:154164:- [translate_table: standard]
MSVDVPTVSYGSAQTPGRMRRRSFSFQLLLPSARFACHHLGGKIRHLWKLHRWITSALSLTKGIQCYQEASPEADPGRAAEPSDAEVAAVSLGSGVRIHPWQHGPPGNGGCAAPATGRAIDPGEGHSFEQEEVTSSAQDGTNWQLATGMHGRYRLAAKDTTDLSKEPLSTTADFLDNSERTRVASRGRSGKLDGGIRAGSQGLLQLKQHNKKRREVQRRRDWAQRRSVATAAPSP